MTDVLRPYQTEVIAKVWRAIEAGHRRILLVAPTASGKTVIARAIIEQARSIACGSLFLAHRREILTQTSNKLRRIPHGIIRPGDRPRPLELIQAASVQTLHRRAVKAGTMELPEAGLVIVDECHHVVARSYQSIIERYPDSILLGLTATPCRGDGRGLGNVFQIMIQCPQVGELVEQGFLVPTRVYAPVDPDLRGVRNRHGDYVESELADRMDRPKLVGDIVTNWLRYGERRKTVCFATNVRHSIHIRDEFVASGVRAEHIDGSTPMDERDATLARLAIGDIEVVTNCMVLTEGWDLPALGCLILARPTKQLGLYRQIDTIDYKETSDLTEALARAAPEGIDVYFDNVGGDHLEAALANAKPFGRFALCGMISQYNASTPPPGPRNVMLIVARSLRLQGFIVSNQLNLQPAFAKDLAAWHAAGQIKWRQTVLDGIERAPEAFLGLFNGKNIGKMLVKLS